MCCIELTCKLWRDNHVSCGLARRRVHSATERRLYARKSMPKLSWWVEGALAMGHITMLGVMSTMPCKTTFKQRKGGQLT